MNGAQKAPSQWRRGGDEEPMKREHLLMIASGKPRSSSLNPLIYPSWWGDDVKEFKKAINMRRDRSQAVASKTAKRGKSKEDSLERRLREARDRKRQQDIQPPQVLHAVPQRGGVFNSNRTAGGLNPSTFISSETGRTASSPSYGYTSAKNAPKYSPIRNARPGANNIPMSYAGPPTQAEINRNQGRLHHANAFSN